MKTVSIGMEGITIHGEEVASVDVTFNEGGLITHIKAFTESGDIILNHSEDEFTVESITLAGHIHNKLNKA